MERSLLRNESSTGAKVPWKESSWTFRSPGANVPRNESSLYGLFAPGNESAEERKGQLPMDSRHLTTLFSVPQGWTVNIILCYFPSLRYLTFTIGRKQHTHYKTPKNGVNLRNNFSVGPRHCGWALQWLTLFSVPNAKNILL